MPERTAHRSGPQAAQDVGAEAGPLHDRLRTWFGVEADSEAGDVDAIHDELRRFLDEAPESLRAWAQQQTSTAHAAHAVLTGRAAAEAGEPLPAALLDINDLDEDLPAPPVAPAPAIPAAPVAPVAAAPAKPLFTPPPRARANVLSVLALIVIIVGVVIGVYHLGDRSEPANDATGGQTSTSAMGAGMGMGPTPVPVDPAQEAALTKKVTANPNDTAAMRDLSNMYVQAADYPNAAKWQAQVLQITPKDTDARLALGASLFNQGDAAGAEREWLEVLRINPQQVEAHYDLGFLYLSKNPPNVPKAEAEWAKVTQLAPGSELAKTAQAHLERLSRMSATPVGNPSPTADAAKVKVP